MTHHTPTSLPIALGRRKFLGAALGGAAASVLPLPALARSGSAGKLRFGVISDLHQDVIHDAADRVAAFVEAMRREKVDFIVQLGDFCQPKPENAPFLEVWNRFEGPRYHVLGNHDMDGGFDREKAVAFLGMPGRYYAFDRGGVRFLVLDGNDPGGTGKGYKRHIGGEQKAWLERELDATRLPVIILIHQPLESEAGIDNQEEILAIIGAKGRPGWPGVAAVLSGHRHLDYVRRIGGIAHIQINSASYVWLGDKARQRVYDGKVHDNHPHLDRVAPYRDPLWAVVTIDHGTGTLSLEGRVSEWVGPDPWARGVAEKDYPKDTNRPAITDWSGRVFSGD